MSTFWSFVKGFLRKQYRVLRRLRRRQRRTSRFALLFFEELESRVVPASYSWTGGAGTLNWAEAGNWSGGVVPGSGDDVTINKSGVGTISITGAQSVRTLNDTTAALSISSGGSLSLAAVAASSTFGQNVTVQSGGALSVGASASILLQPNVTLTDSGTVTFASGDAVNYSYYTTQIIVSSGGLLQASGTTFTGTPGWTSNLIVNSGGELTASNSVFNTLNEVYLDNGSILGASDLTSDSFNSPLWLPESEVRYLSSSGPSQNVQFQDINILSGSVPTGQSLALNVIGSGSTAKLRYVFPGAFTVASGATMSVAAGLPVLLQPNVTLTDSGTVSFANGDAVNYSYYTTQIIVSSGGLLNATGTTFTGYSGWTSNLIVNSGGELTASNSTFNTLNEVYLDNGSILGASDLTGDSFNSPLWLPESEVQYLSSSGPGQNVQFQDINILSGSVPTGQTLVLNVIGSGSTAKLRYVFPGAFTVASGATMTVAAGLPLLLQPNVTLTDSGTVTFASGDAVNYSYYTTQIIVSSGGLLNATGTTFTGYSGWTSNLIVNSGGELTATGSAFNALNTVTLSSGSTDTVQFDTFASQLAINSGATLTINQNDLSNVPGNNNGIVATGSPTSTIDLTNNFWGTGATAAQIAAKIKDHVTDTTRPTVLYQPYLSNEPTQTTAAPASAIYNTAAQNVTLSATVIFAGGHINQGTATFTVLSGSATIGTPVRVNVTNGVATATYALPAATAPGTYTIQAVYNGTSLFAGSRDSSHEMTVSAAATTTAAANASTTYSAASQNVALSATVTSPGGTVNEGTETFTVLSGSATIGSPVTTNVAGGAASVNYTLPAGTSVGTYTIQAVYNGTTNFSTSTDTSHSLTVNPATTTTTAANTSVTYSTSGQSTSLSAAVTSAAGTVNDGTVIFTLLTGLRQGGFETPSVGNSSFQYNPTGSAWVFFSSAGIAANGSSLTSGNPNAPEGTQVAFLQQQGSFSQSVWLNAGTYNLQFEASQRANSQSSSQTFQVLVDGASVATVTPAGTGYSAFTTNTFTVSAGAHDITFAGLDPNGGDNTALVDQVQLNTISGSAVIGTPVTAYVVNGAASATYALPAALPGGTFTIQAVYNGTSNVNTSTDTSHSLTVGANVTGQWQGTLTQGSTTFNYSMSLTQTQGTDTGTSTIQVQAQPQYYGTMNLTGSTSQSTLSFQETTIASQNPPPGFIWLLKSGILQVLGDQSAMTGTWSGGGSGGSVNLIRVYTTTVTAANTAVAFDIGSQNVALSATVTSSGVTVNAGTVTFTVLNGTTVVGTAVTANVVNGAASVTYALPVGLAPGTYSIQAVYSGFGGFTAATDTSHSLTVNPAATVTSAANASATYSAGSQTVSLDATVSSAAGTVNEGQETFTLLNGTAVIGTPVTVNVSSGTASASYTLPGATPAGTYTIRAVYNGTANFTSSTDTSHALTISGSSITTTTTAAAASANYAVATQTVYLNASVTSSGVAVNEGTATFTILSGGTVVGSPVTVNVSNGAAPAAYALPGETPAGTYTIQAVYNGTANFPSSSDTSQTLTVKPAFTTTSAANTLVSYSAADQTVSLGASVISPAGTVNEGTETFTILSGGMVLGSPVSVSVSGGAASANYTLPGGTPHGAYTIQAAYTDASNFAGSSDTSHSVTVGPAATTTAATTVSTSYSASSQTVALGATVSSPAVAVNEGSVTFTVQSGSTVIGTPVKANVVNGAASANYTLPAGLADGIYTIQAAYGGTDHFASSTDSSQDLLVGTIIWVSQTGGSWDDPNNWLPHRLPQATDEVVIPETGLTITKTGGSIDVLSVNSQSALSLSGASLTVTSGASQIAALSMTGASALTAQGAGTTFTVTGTTDIDGASVTASGGGQVSLPEVTSVNDATAGLSGSISALSGGVVSLPNLAAVTVTGPGSTANLLADGAGSLLDVPVLTTISGASSLTATNQGTVNAPVLTSLDGTSVTLGGTSTLPTAQVVTLTDGELTVGGGSYDFSGLTHLDDSGVSVSGGITVSLSGVTSYQAGDGTLQASGAGSVLALPNLTVLSETVAGDSGSVQTLSGGEVNLSELQAVTVNPASTVSLLADGMGSLLNLPALVGISGPNSLTATHQGIIAAPLMTTLTNTDLTLDGSSPLTAAQLVSFTDGQLNLSAAYDFSKLTDLDGSSVLVSGGASQSLPGVTIYQSGSATLEASGAGSVLTLPNLTQLTETDPGTTFTVSALAGGEVSLPDLASVSATGSGSAANLSADGSGSTLNLPDLATLSGDSGTTSSLTLSNGGTANVSPAGLAVSTALVEVGSGATLTGPLTLNTGGILGGQGTVLGNVVNNAGTIAPDDPKRIIIQGDYHQGPNGTLALEIEGTTPGTEYDQIVIAGTAYLDGTLNVTYLNGYHPQAADAYQVMTYAAVVGDFATFQQPDMTLSEDLTTTSLSLLADAIGVTTTADSGPGSLRQAIIDANAQPGPTLIYFSLPGSGVQTIAPLSALPAITGQVLIDGTTQAGYAGTPVVRLDGSASGDADGLVLTGGQSTVRGLAIGGFHDAIVLSGNGNDIVRGNYLGVDTDGTTAFPNSGAGVRLADSSNNLIGGAGPGQGNTIANNAGAGIAVTGASTGDALRGNVLYGNGGPGIDLGDNGHTPNDSLGHSGPNAYLNFPMLASATLGQTTVIQGELLSNPLNTYVLDFYASPVKEADGGARAGRYLGSTQVTTDATGMARFNVSLNAATGPGEYLTATATDSSNDTSELANPLQGANYNPPPGVTITGPAGSPVGAPVAFQSQVSDSAAGRTFTYLWSVAQAGNPSFQLPDQTVLTEPNFTFTPQAVGTYDVTLVVTDNLGATGKASFVLSVTPQPVLVALTGGPISATPFTTVTLTGTVETAPGTSLTGTPAWGATLNGQPFALPPGGTDAAGRPTLSFVVPGPGTYAVTLSATNNTGGTGSGTFTVVASNGVAIVGLPANSRPTVPLHLSATVDDPNLVGPLTYDWSVTRDGNPFASQQGTDCTFSFTPDQAGTFAVSVTVTDADGQTVSASASTAVPNVLAILGLKDHAAMGQTVALQATGFGPAASAVDWAVFNAAGHLVGVGTGADFSYVPIDPGVDLITLTSPGQATSATLPILAPSLTVTLSSSPTPPPQGSPLTLTADLAGATAGATYSYTWTVTDGNGQIVASGPGTTQSAAQGTFTFTPYLPGPYAVKVTVVGTDSSFGAATSSFTVIDVPPTVTLGGLPAGAVPEGTFLHLVALANDAGGTTDVLRFAWTVTGPDGFSRAGSNSTLDFVPVETGAYAVAVTVTDSSGQSATASTDITVIHVQPVAVISAGPGTHIDPVAGVATIQVLANVPDPGSDSDNFQYSWLITDDNRGGAVVAQQGPGATDRPSLTFSGPSADNYTLTLRVTDDDGGDATVVVPIRIGVTSTVTLTNGSLPANAAMVLGVAYSGTVIDASGLSVAFTGVALGSHDTLIGGAGPNVLQGDSGFNLLEGGTGSNTMYATGGDTLVGGGGTGTDLFALIPSPADAPQAPISLQPDATRQSTLSFAQAANGISFNATLTGGQEQTLATGDLLELFGALQQVVGSPGNDSLVAGNGTTLFGGGGNDTLVASGGSNIALVAGSQADLLAAQASADLTLFGTNPVVTPETGTPITLFGGSGQSLLISNNSNNVTLLGGSGDTTLSASGGTNVTLFGGSGNSQLTSTNANNVSMIGGSGNATLLASGGTSVTLFGGSGNSQLTSTNANNVSMIGGSGNATLLASGGTSVTLFGGSGNSQLTSTNANNVTMIGGSGNATLLASGGTSVTLFGGSGNAMLTSANANNVSMIGLSGSDTLMASGGTQVTLFGGTGNDLLQASGVTQAVLASGSGDTLLKVSDSTEVTLFGGSGNSQLTSTNSNNVSMIGGSGNATLLASGGTNVTLFGGSGNAMLTSANANNVTMVGGSGNATLLASGGTSVTLFGGSGNDSLQATGGSSLLLIGGTGSDVLATSGGTSVTLFGGSGNSQLTSTNANNVSMIGGSGNATLLASGGTSVTLFGGSGNAMLTSTNANNVSMIGGSGNATLLASGGTSVTLFGGSGNSQLTSTNSNNVSMIGGSGNDSLIASSGTSVTLFGGSGNDSLQAAGGSDLVMVGGSGNDTLSASGSTGATLFGGSGSNTLTSTNSNNVLMIGGSGNATLTASGGTGVTLFGGDGSDSLASSNVTSLLMTGGAGRDTLTSANDTDAVLQSGGRSNDLLAETDGTGVAVMGGGGDDTLSAAGGTGISLSGLDGNNLYQLTGTPADPLDVALNDLGTFGSSIISTDGTSDGINTIAFPGVTSGITLDLSNASLGPTPGPQQQQQVAPGLTLSLTGFFQNVIGTAGANWIKGDPAVNVLQGQGGNDTLIGGSGSATLVAGNGSDVLMGGSGGTTYRFAGTGLGSGTVEPLSDTSNDTLDFSQLGGAVTLDLTSAAAQPVSPAAGLTLTMTHPLGITGVMDTAFNDSITGNARDDVFTVQGGNDTFTGGGGNDTYNFSAASRGTKILNETPATNNALNFHAFDGPVKIDLKQSGPQVVSPGSLTLTLAPPMAFDRVIGSRFPDTIVGNDRGDTLIGGGGGDLIASGSGADFIQGGITQVVYLDFDAGSQPGYHVYTPVERDDIQARLEAIYKNFSLVFTQDPAHAAQLAQVTGGQFATLNFNVGPYPGASHELDTENLDLGGSATINVNPAVGADPGLVPDTSDNVVGLTATIAAHELGHLVGLEHGDAFGPIDTGIYAGVDPDEFLPDYTGPDDAVDTPSDIMASPASVNSPLIDAAEPTQLGERDALRLAFNDNGTLLRAQDLTGLVQPVNGVSFSTASGGVDQVTSAVALGELPQLAVPNTLLDPSSGGYGRTFQAVALGVLGTIATPGQEDFYAITGHAGEVMSFEVASEDNSLNPRPFPPELVVLDGAGHVLGYNVLNFESGDPMILDVTLPAEGTYYVGVDAYGGQATGNYRLLMYSLSAVSGGAPQGNGVTVYGSGGNDTLVGSSGDDTFIYQAGAVGQVAIQASSGADVLDLRRTPPVSYALTGDPALGTLTVLTQIATALTLTSDHPAGSTYGQAVTFTATVNAAITSAGTPPGSVQFQVDGNNFGAPVALTNGTASITTSALSAGRHNITASYISDASNFAKSSTPSPLSQMVTPAVLTVTALDASKPYGDAVPALIATITGFVNGETLATSGATGSSALATKATSSSPVGSYTITASQGTLAASNYTFDFVNGTLAVNPATTGTSLSASLLTPLAGVDKVMLTARVTFTPPGSGSPTGSIDFFDTTTGTDLGNAHLSGGRATITLPSLVAGRHILRATYSGDGNFLSSSGTLSLTALVPVNSAPVPPIRLPPSRPPTLKVPPLLALLNQLLGEVETVNANSTETITDYFLGIPLLVETYDSSGNLVSVNLFGFNITFLFV